MTPSGPSEEALAAVNELYECGWLGMSSHREAMAAIIDKHLPTAELRECLRDATELFHLGGELTRITLWRERAEHMLGKE